MKFIIMVALLLARTPALADPILLQCVLGEYGSNKETWVFKIDSDEESVKSMTPSYEIEKIIFAEDKITLLIPRKVVEYTNGWKAHEDCRSLKADARRAYKDAYNYSPELFDDCSHRNEIEHDGMTIFLISRLTLGASRLDFDVTDKQNPRQLGEKHGPCKKAKPQF